MLLQLAKLGNRHIGPKFRDQRCADESPGAGGGVGVGRGRCWRRRTARCLCNGRWSILRGGPAAFPVRHFEVRFVERQIPQSPDSVFQNQMIVGIHRAEQRARTLLRCVWMEQVRAHTRRTAIGRDIDDRLNAPVERNTGLFCAQTDRVPVFQEQPMRDAVVAGVVAGKRNLLGTGFAEQSRQPVPLRIIGKETIGRRHVLGSA